MSMQSCVRMCVSTFLHSQAEEKKLHKKLSLYLNITYGKLTLNSTHRNTYTHTHTSPSRRSLMASCQPNRCLITDLYDIIKQSSLWKVWQDASAQSGATVNQTLASPPCDGAVANQPNGSRRPWLIQIHFHMWGGIIILSIRIRASSF